MLQFREFTSRAADARTQAARLPSLWWVAAAVVAGLYTVLIAIGFTHSPVDVDEGYGLSIVRNLVDGHGFTSDAIGNEGRSGVFDPRASTGPTVLLPAAALHATGLDLVASGRIVATLFSLALVAGLGLWGWRLGGPWAALAAACAPLVLDTFSSDISPIYGPTDMLGEVPVAALMVWAFVAVSKRPRLAAALTGLSIAAKLVALFLVPALIVAFLVTSRKGTRVRGLIVSGLIAAVPTLAYEVAAFAARGVAGDRARLGQYAALMREQRISQPLIRDKLMTLATSWFVRGSVAFALLLIILALLIFAWARMVRTGGGNRAVLKRILRDPRGAIIVVGAIAAGVPILQWLQSTTTSAQWIRHPAPGLFIGAALLLATLAAIIVRFAGTPGWTGRVFQAAALVVVGVLCFQSVQHVALALKPQRYGTLAEQRDLAARVRATGTPLVQGDWGIGITIAAMADLDMTDVNFDPVAGALVLVDEYPRAMAPAFIGPQRAAWCGDVILEGPLVACWPADAIGTPDLG